MVVEGRGSSTVYVNPNFKTKKALMEAVVRGDVVSVFQPGGIFSGETASHVWVTIEGPHYPAPHSWYARALIVDGVIVGVK